MVFPDHELSGDAYRLLNHRDVTLLTHPSGRPWIAGSWAPNECTVFEWQDSAVAFLGLHDATPCNIAEVVGRGKSSEAWHYIASRFRGSFNLVGSIGGEVRVRGTISGIRRVFYSRVGSIDVAASHADILAALQRKSPDPAVVAARMLFPNAPHPLELVPLWEGVWPVPEDSLLRFNADGLALIEPWWSPPDPQLSLQEGAAVLREELQRAVSVVVKKGSQVTADLSGGLDSTPLCFLASSLTDNLITFTAAGSDANDDDSIWADLAAGHLRARQRRLIPSDHLPLPYADAEKSVELRTDEPFLGAVNVGRILCTARLVAEHRSEIHITGHGGDEVVSAPESYIFDLVCRHPWKGIRRLREYRARRRWSLSAVGWRLADRSSYDGWLRGVAEKIELPLADSRIPPSVWGSIEPRLPQWATSDAREAVRTLLTSSAAKARQLGWTKSQHAAVSLIRESGRSNRLVAEVMRSVGVQMAAPFLDDHVIESAAASKVEIM